MTRFAITIYFVNSKVEKTYEVEASSLAHDSVLKNKAIEVANETAEGAELVKNNPLIKISFIKRL